MTHDPWGDVLEGAGRALAAAETSLSWAHLAPRFEDPPEGMGDLAIPMFPYAKALRKSPAELAAELANGLPPNPWFPRVAAVGAYVNLTVSDAKLADLTLSSAGERRAAYGALPSNGRRVLLEHTSVNPTGPIHVGRARNALIGDALARILRLAGYAVTTEFLVNDIGRQMVLLAWGVRHLDESSLPPSERERDDYRLMRAYVAANVRAGEDPDVNREIESMIYRLENGDDALTRDIRGIAERILAGISATLTRIDISFDAYFWESELILKGKVVPVLDRLKALKESAIEDGAHFIDLAPFGVQGRNTKWFFTRKDGTSVYPARDVAYHLDKFARSEEAIVVLGENHRLENTQLRVALKLLGTGRDVEPVFYSYVSLPEGGMSMRRGRVVFVDDLVDEAIARAYAEVTKRRPELPEERRWQIADFVGIGSLRYNVSRVQAEKPIVFQWEDALNFEGDSAPFLQYAHARACSILEKAGAPAKFDAATLGHESERKLVRIIAKLPSTIASCAANRRVHPLATYANALASQFNQFYRDCPVLLAEEPLRSSRLVLVEATRFALGTSLRGIGLVAPAEM